MFSLQVYLDYNLQPNLNVQEPGCPKLYIYYNISPNVRKIYYLKNFYESYDSYLP